MTRRSEGLRLLLVNDPLPAGKARGGVQLLSDTLREAGGEFTEVVEVATSSVEDHLGNSEPSRTVVYLQRSGDLSADFRARASRWLRSGALILEKNVFAKASGYRPIHDNYRMIVMSQDGAVRYSLRSKVAGLRPQPTFLVLGNPTFSHLHDRSQNRYRLSDGGPRVITFLRVGRPDPIKWSEFEVRFCVELANSWRTRVRLIRVGHPTGPGTRQEGRVTIDDLPYGSSLAPLYNQADVYLHHSRIGETFGNTVAEASRFGLKVILGVDIGWDAAHVELLSSSGSVYGVPNRLIKNASDVTQHVIDDRERYEKASALSANVSAQLTPEYMLSVFSDLRCGRRVEAETFPSSHQEIFRHFNALARGGWAGSFSDVLVGVARESVRAARNFRWQE